ncbi:sacsin-like isoform X2 [Hyla sarda]|nr:sacsin-like isoform X2 [Hyla sarda]XP_056400808.1 sacsin-like isoform X2 [Hyla sarda]XP_056400809.1 sacsin-like isoform X2 [Hyla sarda]XP_056400810.1 sacsin-like isoform X2 [Hyla sarda]
MDFFQRAPPFLIQLQSILRKYPDGGQILKELIQNADDAKASEVIFAFDERPYGTNTLYAKGQHIIQGQSLLVYNNEMFSDRDWEGIQRPGNSIKRKDPDTVGRFGLGFNSVYHITDYPAIFSGKNVGILDPQENIFYRGGSLWNLEKKDEFSEDLEDQFQPFKNVLQTLGLGSWEEILASGFFKGTLFCFPLRLCPSEISDNIYSTERVEELFESFMKDSNIALLFLRHIKSISLKKIGNDGIMKSLLTVKVSTEELLETESAGITIQTACKVVSLKFMDNKEEQCKWLMTTSRDQENLFPELTEMSNKLCNRPVLDLAYPLSKQNMGLFGGRLNCILPLPDKEENQTGLPCLINGCFDLTDDRRSMKWPEADQQHDDGAKWNQILVEQVLPFIYSQAVKNVVSLVKMSKISVDIAYRIWPDPEKNIHKPRWYEIVKQIAFCLEKETVLQTIDTTRWITASEAVFLEVENVKINTCIEELLLHLKTPLVKVPGHVFKVLQIATKDISGLNIVSPKFVRNLLHTDEWLHFSTEKKLLLLTYIISDGQHNELLNLKLLPLSDGSFTYYQNTETNGIVYIDSKVFPRTLLPGLAHRFIPEDLPDDLRLFLVNIGKLGTFKNLVCLTKEVICKTLREALPLKWQNCTDEVRWYPGESDNPPAQWIVTLWTFLQQYDDILDFLENQPIVPLTPIKESANGILLARLKRKAILFQKSDDHRIAEAITVILEKAGCTIIRDTNDWLWHKNLHFFILVPTPNNILQILSNLNISHITEILKTAPKEDIKLLSDLFSQAYHFTSSELDILYKLPVFCSVKTITSSHYNLVDARCLTALDCNLVPAVPDILVFPDVVIKCRDESDRRLLQLMNIRLLNAVDAALLIVKAIQKGSYINQEKEIQNVMFWILRNGYSFFTQSDQLKSMCKNLHFIPCNGHFLPPSALYDPKINTLRVLFESDKFPPVNYHEDSVLMSLRMLGLLDSIHKITPENILEIAQQLSQGEDVPSILSKADALIEVCNNTIVLSKFSSHNLKILCGLSWVPIICEGSNTTLREPKHVRSMKYCNIIEFSMPLTNCFIEKANNILGLNDLPPPEKVVGNLKALSLNYRSMDQYSFYRKLHDIYKYLQDHIEQIHSDIPKKVVIWNGKDFSFPHETVLCYPEGLDLSSCVHKVPPDFLTYKYLFKRCGVQSTLPHNEVIHILHTLKNGIDNECYDSGSPKDLKLVISILDWMKVNSVSISDELPVPVQSDKKYFSLKSLSKTLYCDMEKQYLTSASAKYIDYGIVHEEISLATAKYLKIQFLSTKVLKPEFFDPWGPSEPVTLRIKNILREYSEHVELFKEMIQNADDADATACHFLVDMRQNSEIRQRLIDPGMGSCHGPALWSYNNSKFTDMDFSNIIRIGAATKEANVQKIGKFGLGFNTVYHITDVPSIMSGSKVLIFDPNANHLQKHISQKNPGMKLDLQNNSELLHIFSDQFQPYSNVFGCKLAQPFYFDGTLIRLPFRTEEEARETEICQQPFDEVQINVFMTNFENSSETLLTFLRNVKEVSLSYLSNGQCPGFQTTKVHLQKETVQTLNVSPNVLLQQEQLNVSKQLCEHMDILDVNCTNIVEITTQKSNTTDTKFYLMQSGLGIKQSFKNVMQKENLLCLPVAGVALPLKKNPSTGKWTANLEGFKGMMFCFLPLPVFNGLPFHINGTFSVMSNRKTLWETTIKGEWNKHLLSDAVLVAVITALLQLQELNQNGDIEDYYYHTFWPDITKVNTLFMEMVKSFYHAIAFGLERFLPPLFNNGRKCCTIKHACFLDLEIFKDEKIQQLAKKVFSMHLRKPYMAVDLPDWVKHSFNVSNSDSELEKNYYNYERFYREIVFENLDCLEQEDRNALIIYAIDLKNKELNSVLVSKPCIPSSLHENLQFITNLVHPMGKVSALYDPEEGRFPDGSEFLKVERLENLHTLGLVKDKLPLVELMSRANKIENIWKYDRKKALKQILCVLELLNDLLKEFGSFENQYFKDIVFLPAVPPQSNAVELNDLTLMKAKDLFQYKHKALVCMVHPVISQKHLESLRLPANVMAFLGIDHQPSFQVVISQLQKVSEGMNFLNNEESFTIAKECYAYLNDLLQMKPNHADLIKELASAFPFVFIDNEFVHVNVVAHKLPFDVSPYLYKLPKYYDNLKNLWKSVGIGREFSFNHYFSILEQIAINHQGTPLSQSELSMIIRIINHCLDKIPENDNSFETKPVFVPDMKCILRHVDKIFYNDTPWLPCDEELNFCNERLPRAVVSKLRIKTRIHHTLQNLKCSNLSKWGSQFGAKEKITTRIQNILKEYSLKKDILKELLQNADDAEATEVHFVLDCRTHETEKVFGDEWHPLQGPALCVYNNKTFSTEDIDGIQHLGIGGKEKHLDKTGKFGLGFNSVFHITDCPSFVSADTIMCVFDPNLLFLDCSDDTSPGQMFTVNNQFKMTFQNVYDTFLPSMFNLQKGTIFRLPLRMANTVAKSKISDQISSMEDIRNMCKELDKDADMILFLNHIRKITFSEISSTGNVKEIFFVEAKMDEINTKQISLFQQKLSNYVGNEAPLYGNSPFRIISEVEIKCSSSDTTTYWLIARQLGIEDMNGFSTLEEISSNLHQILIPHGSIAACLNKPVKGRAFCTLPLPLETGLPVHINANFIVDAARRNICTEDGDSPKTAWNVFLLSNITAPLYCFLLDCLRKEFTKYKEKSLHFQCFDSCKIFLDKFFSFFPTNTKCVPPHWKAVVTKVYLMAFEHKLQVIPVYKKMYSKIKSSTKGIVVVQWSHIGKSSITEEPVFLIPEKDKDIEPVLLNINMQLAYGGRVCKAFKEAGVNVLELTPHTLCCFLKEIPLLANGNCLPVPVSSSIFRNKETCNSLLHFCLNFDLSKNKLDLQGVPLVVTTDGMLHYFDRDEPKFSPLFAKLFPKASSEFIQYWDTTSLLKEYGFVRCLDIKSSVSLVKNHLGSRFEISTKTNASDLPLSKDIAAWLEDLWLFFKSEIMRQMPGQEKEQFDEICAVFNQWAIVPVYLKTSSDKEYINVRPLADLKNMCFPSSSEMTKCLFKLGFPKLKWSAFPESIISYFKPYMLNIENLQLVLEQLNARKDLQWKLMDTTELDTLLFLILQKLPSTQNKDTLLKKLKSLPLFETIQGKRQNLVDCKELYLLDTTFDLEPFRLSDLRPSVIYLKNNDHNKRVSKLMNIPLINSLELLADHLLLDVASLNEDQLLHILCMVLQLWHCQDFKSKEKQIITSLKSVRLIKDKYGVLQKASFFYDDKVELFSVLELHEHFIPNSFWKKFGENQRKLRSFLRSLGMKASLTETDFIKFATEIEKNAILKTSLESLHAKADALYNYLLSMNSDDISCSFVAEVGHIAFVIPLKVRDELNALHSSFTEKVATIALNGSLMNGNTYESLVWTSMPLLKNSVYSRDTEALLGKIGVLHKPPIEKIIDHIQNVCKVTCGSKDLQKTRSTILKRIYDFLQNKSKIDLTILKDVLFILVKDGMNTALPRQVVFNLQEENIFWPYLYKLPPLLACYSDLFQKVGVEAELTVFHFVNLLSTVYTETLEKTSLHPNLHKTVCKATRQLFHLLREKKDAQHINSLHLLAMDGKLYESSSLVLNNCRSYKTASKLQSTFKFVYTPDVSVRYDCYELENLLKYLPKKIRPRMLSEITNESLNCENLCSYGDHCPLKIKFEELFFSAEFQDGLVCLLQYQTKGKITQEEAKQNSNLIFGRLEIICCSQLQTVLLYEDKPLDGTQCNKTVFAVKHKDTGGQIYFQHSDSLKGSKMTKVVQVLAKEINDLMENVLAPTSIDIVSQMLSCNDPNEITEVLKDNNLWNSISTQRIFSLPNPGDKISIEWYDCLDMSIINTFNIGEYVGYMIPSEEECYLYAVIVEELDKKVLGSCEIEMYLINIGQNNVIEVSVLDLYQFKRSENKSMKALCLLGSTQPPKSQTFSYERIKKEIDLYLSKIWGLPENERRQATRRLYLKYHPDKNIDQEKLYTEVFKYLQQRLKEMEYSQRNSNHSSQSPTFHFRNSGGSYNFWTKWDNQASNHRHSREHFSRTTRCNYNFWEYYSTFTHPKPQEAKRWLRQAICDLKAAERDVGHTHTEWVFYKVHQAVEKALCAAQYIKTGKINKDYTIVALAKIVSTYCDDLQSICDKVLQLKACGVDKEGTQYPSFHSPPGIPNNCLDPGQEDKVIALAKHILNKIESYILK